MKTTQQALEDKVYSCGVFESDAHNIVELAKPIIDSFNKAHADGYEITWDRPAEEYPPELYNVLLKMVAPVAVKYAEEHRPMAWWKSVFKALT